MHAEWWDWMDAPIIKNGRYDGKPRIWTVTIRATLVDESVVRLSFSTKPRKCLPSDLAPLAHSEVFKITQEDGKICGMHMIAIPR